MTTTKISLSLDEQLVAEARSRVGARELSSYVNRALEQQLQHDRVAALLAEMDLEYGPVEPALMSEIRESWPDPDPEQR